MKTMSKSRNLKKQILLVGMILTGLSLIGCSSDSNQPSLAAPQVAIDTAPPAVPVGLNASAVDSHVKVGWMPNTTDADFAGFMLYRIAFGETWALLDAPTTDTSFVDESPLIRPYRYAVTAVDDKGNESAWLDISFQGMANRPELDSQ